MDQEYHLSLRFDAVVAGDPDAECLVAGRRTYTYQRLAAEAAMFGAALSDLGIGKGDRIGVDLPNWPEWIVCLLAASRLGAVVVPLNPMLGYHEFKYQLRHAEVRVCVVPQSYEGVDYTEYFDELISDLPDLNYLVTVGSQEMWQDQRVFRYVDLLSSYRSRPREQPANLDPAAHTLMLIYTPGTQGKPKGVELSHRNLVWTALETAGALGIEKSDVVLGAVPLFTVFGAHVVISTLLTGGRIVLAERFDAGTVLDLVERHSITVFHGVPTMFQLIMREASFPARDLSSLRTGIVAGSPVSPQQARALREWCNAEIAYGLTETGPTVTITRPEDPVAAREATVGRPLGGVEVKLLEQTEDDDFVAGPVGQLAVRGPNVVAGYYRMPVESLKYMSQDGFFKTGDLASIDADGFVSIVGRSKDMIIRGGYNIYPRELEDILRTHPAVEAVCAVGTPNEILGELVSVCVIPVEGAIVTARELREYVRDQVADYKVPDLVRFYDSFPTSNDGKVQRGELARLVAAEVSTG